MRGVSWAAAGITKVRHAARTMNEIRFMDVSFGGPYRRPFSNQSTAAEPSVPSASCGRGGS